MREKAGEGHTPACLLASVTAGRVEGRVTGDQPLYCRYACLRTSQGPAAFCDLKNNLLRKENTKLNIHYLTTVKYGTKN